ncbi:OsmC family protein [Alistipes sp.]|uniref:OsmC family protein n=1 Tax=Alistipes sp. TaxID=1872444 RepID=UPI003AF0A956
MIEKVTLQLTHDGKLTSGEGPRCEEMNPKALLLLAAAKCAGLTSLHIMEKERIRPKRFEIAVSGELSTDTVQSESMFLSFHAFYNVECDTEDDQVKVGRAVRLAQEKHCSLMQMLRRIAPVTHEIAVVSTEAEKV